MGRTFNGDTPATIERLVRDTLWRAAAKKQEQGRTLRILDKVNLTAEIIGRKGALSNLLRHLAQSHSQKYYKGKEYKDLHDEFYVLCESLDIQPKDFFKAAYKVLINKERGPKLAGFILMLGKQALTLLEKATA